MGYGQWSSSNWTNYSTTKNLSNSNARAIYSNSQAKEIYLPKNVTRESRDSVEHPNSTPIIIGLDTTGSMGHLLETIARSLGDLMGDIINKEPISDPQIMCCAIDDYFAHSTPLQVTQFESDIRIAEQLTDLHFTRRGGGNGFESYPLCWYFAANHTSIDCYEKHNRKGFIFTMGDDGFPSKMSKEEIYDVFGDKISKDIDVYELVEEVSEKYELFHLCIARGGSYRESDYHNYRELLGNHAIKVNDSECIPQIITAILEKYAGKFDAEIVKNYDVSTANVVLDAIKNIQV